MEINEILNISMQSNSGVNLSAFDVDSAKQITTAENIPLYFTTAENTELYFLKKDDELLSFILCIPTKINNTEYLVVHRTWTDPNNKGKGYGTVLYATLITKLQKKLLSDDKQTPTIRNIWKQAEKVLDTTTNSIINRDEISDDEIYIDGSKKSNKSRRYRLVMENIITPNEFDRPLIDNIINDNLIITHPDNDGKYE